MLKTIKQSSPSVFDDDVNEYLKDGWALLSVHVEKGHESKLWLVAFLAKE